MTHCRACKRLQATDTTLQCELTGHSCYIDDLPLTVMDDCPLCNNTECVYHADAPCPAADGCGGYKEDK